MKKYLIYIASVLAVSAFTGCSTNEHDEVQPEQALRIASVGIDSPFISRAVTDYTAANVGIFVEERENVELSYASNVWSMGTTVLIRQSATSIPIIAYAPYSSSVSNSTLTLPNLASQTGGVTTANDILYMNDEAVTVANGAVTIGLNHALAKLKINITYSGTNLGSGTNTISSVTVSGLKVAGALDLAGGEFTISGDATDIAAPTSTVGEILIIPQSATPTIEIVTVNNGKEYSTTAKFNAAQTFEGGKAYDVTIAATKSFGAETLSLSATETEW